MNPRDGLATAITGEYRSVNSLVHGSLTSTVAAVALPAVASTLLMTLFATVDAYWVGTRIGPRGLAAVSTSIFWVWMLISCAEMVSVGLTAVAARRHGERSHEAAARAVSDALFLSVALAILLAGVGFANLDALFGIMHTPPEVTALGKHYLGTYLFGAPLIFGFFAIDAAFRAAGDTHTPFLLLLGCVIAALLLDPVLILGLGPAPRLGIAGAAVATIFSRSVAFLIGIVILVRRRMVTFGAPSLPDAALDRARRSADGDDGSRVQCDLRTSHAHDHDVRHSRTRRARRRPSRGELVVYGRHRIRCGGRRDRRAKSRREAGGAR